jgi:hypothetical protein
MLSLVFTPNVAARLMPQQMVHHPFLTRPIVDATADDDAPVEETGGGIVEPAEHGEAIDRRPEHTELRDRPGRPDTDACDEGPTEDSAVVVDSGCC